MDQRKNNSSRLPENNKTRKMDVGRSCGKKKRRKMDYSCDRVGTTHQEKKSGQTVQEMARRNRQVLGDACLDRTYKGQKILEKTCVDGKQCLLIINADRARLEIKSLKVCTLIAGRFSLSHGLSGHPSSPRKLSFLFPFRFRPGIAGGNSGELKTEMNQ